MRLGSRLWVGVVSFPAVILSGSMSLDFSHSYVGPGTVAQNVGELSLEFAVNDSGQVTVDASCTDPDPVSYVNEMDGFVGTVEDSGLFGTTFTITVSGIGNLRIDNAGQGLCIQGANPQRLDGASEGITFTLETQDLEMDVQAIGYAGSNGRSMEVEGTSYAIGSGSGTVTLSERLTGSRAEITSLNDDEMEGFVLSGLQFRIISATTHTIQVGANILQPESILLSGANDSYPFDPNTYSALVLGGAGSIVTQPSNNGSSPLELGSAELRIEEGARWILDGANYSGSFDPGTRFTMANYGSFSGHTTGIRHRGFTVPPNRNLKLVQSAQSLYFEVIAQDTPQGPNIILINMDDMSGGHHFGFEGRDALTPTIDGLAQNGLVFTNAFAATSVCSPTRYSLLTGRWPSSNPSAAFLQTHPTNTLARFVNIGSELPAGRDNIAGWLQQLGYRTGFVGKSHIIEHHLLNASNWTAGGLQTYDKASDPAVDATTNAAMQFNHRVIAQRHQPYGFDFAGGVYLGNLKELYNTDSNVHNQEWLTQYALQFLEENRSQRFFLYIAPTINHGPVNDNLRYSLRANPNYTGEGHIANPDFSFMPTRSSIVNEVRSAGKDDPTARETWVDYSIAAILNQLETFGLRDDTLIILTSDHGHITLRDANPLSGKSSLYDAGLKVPLVLHWPNGIVSPGRDYTSLIQPTDIAPTLLAIAGGSNLPQASVDGLDFSSVMFGSSTPVREVVYSEIGYARAVRSLDWKLIALRYPASVQQQIDSGYLWSEHNTGDSILPRPYYVVNTGLSYGPSRSYPHYFDDNQLYRLSTDHREQDNVYGTAAAIQVELKQLLSSYAGRIDSRPFGEFAPLPVSRPSAVANGTVHFDDALDGTVQWTDSSSDELGYFIEQSLDGGTWEIIEDLPLNSTNWSIRLASPEEDMRIRISPYNELGAALSLTTIDFLAPEYWQQRLFSKVNPSERPSVSDWSADPDNDGLNNLLEYAFSLNPLSPETVVWPVAQLRRIGAETFLETKIPWDGRRVVDIFGMLSLDLDRWQTGDSFVSLVEDGESYFLRSTTSIEVNPQQFIQVQITLP